VKNCKAYNCTYGIELDSCWYARVENCDVWFNRVGIMIHSWGTTRYNTITECHAYSNDTGILAYDPRSPGGYNKIYHNNLENNTQYQAQDYQRYPNEWDNGYPDGGNYWSDYTGADNYSGVNQDEPGSDGIGDTPYPIYGSAGSQDRYPFMRPVGWIPAIIDIKPQSCPNPLNVRSKGVLPVAILGTEDVNVYDINVPTLLLEGVAPIRSNYEDVATPVMDGQECECTTEGPDGYLDLTLKFETEEIVNALGEVVNGETLVLTLTGESLDGTPIEGSDCILVISKKGKGGNE